MTNHVATYPTDEQLGRWQAEVDEMDISMSEWVASMVEAGMKNFSAGGVEPDEDISELREQRNNLRRELDAARSRVQELETALYEGEREAIVEFVESNPGVSYSETVQHVIDSAPARVTRQLNVLEGDRLHREGNAFYSLGEDS